MKRLALHILILSLLAISCNTILGLNPATQTPELTSPSDSNPTEDSTQTPGILKDIRARLQELGGERCSEKPGFICVTLSVPLDHFDPANTQTINVVFAVAPAKGERKGFYFQAFPGGPGGEGISTGSTGYFPTGITNAYDIVYFDQRGLGLSNPLECKSTYAAYFLGQMNFNDTLGDEGYDTPQEQQDAIQTAKTFVDDCLNEIGIDPEELKFFDTEQVAEDIESFRQAIGDDKFMLYGDSYGTEIAQTYARAHADHLSGLILDGTIDTTLSRDQLDLSQIDAFNKVLLEVFKACDASPDCSAGMSDGSQAAYDELAQKLADAPIPYTFPLSNGDKAQRLFTYNMLDYTTAYQLYGLEDRWDLMRAVAAADEGDMLPLVRLYYDNANIDPGTGNYLGDPSFSDTMFYIVWCGDGAYYRGTSEERTASILEEGEKQSGIATRLDVGFVPFALFCAFLPDSPTEPEQLTPLKAEGVPTIVLNATLDPATPFQGGKAVFEHLDNGYHIYVNGGVHVVYLSGYSCPNRYVDDFLVNGILPEQREIVCDWGNAVISP